MLSVTEAIQLPDSLALNTSNYPHQRKWGDVGAVVPVAMVTQVPLVCCVQGRI